MKKVNLVNIGFGNIISAARLITIANPESSPIKRLIQEAKQQKMLVDATCGRKTRAVLVMDSQHVILSALQTETIANRLSNSEEIKQPENN